jgi:hypothetical protein
VIESSRELSRKRNGRRYSRLRIISDFLFWRGNVGNITLHTHATKTYHQSEIILIDLSISTTRQTKATFAHGSVLSSNLKRNIELMDPTEELAVSEILKAARIPWSELDCRTQRNDEGKVVKFRFSPCLGLEEIPLVIGDLTSLEEIYLFWASRRLTHLPSDGFDRLHNLRVLHIRWCQGLKELPRLCNSLEELIIEGCSDIVDLSCFRTAKLTWTKLRCLHIIQVGTRGVASLVEAFSTEEYRDDCDANGEERTELNGTPSIFFPSLTSLSLRHDSIDQADLAKLWPFFRHCPRLIKIDLGNNRISSLENLVPVATAIGPSKSEKQESPRMSLRELSLSGNPFCSFSPNASRYDFHSNHADENNNERVVDDSDIDSAMQEDTIERAVIAPCQIQKSNRQAEYLLSIISANPQLVSILVCSGNCKQTIDTNSSSSGCHHSPCLSRNRCDCFQHSALYSPRIRLALDLNQCSKGKTLMATRPIISHGKDTSSDEVSKPFSLSNWPLVLNRTNQISDFPPLIDGREDSQCHRRCVECQGCSSEIVCDEISATNRALRERQASVLYSLLQGPIFAARGNL